MHAHSKNTVLGDTLDCFLHPLWGYLQDCSSLTGEIAIYTENTFHWLPWFFPSKAERSLSLSCIPDVYINFQGWLPGILRLWFFSYTEFFLCVQYFWGIKIYKVLKMFLMYQKAIYSVSGETRDEISVFVWAHISVWCFFRWIKKNSDILVAIYSWEVSSRN